MHRSIKFVGLLQISVALTIISGTAFAQDDTDAKPKSMADKLALTPLADGAESPEKAIDAYVKASVIGDIEAAVLMFDPLARDLFLPELIFQQIHIETKLLENSHFGEAPKPFVRGFSFLFADRDLVRIESARILERRNIDKTRVAFTVITTEQSYHDDKKLNNIRQMLTVRRDGRWYVFRMIGHINNTLRMSLTDDLGKDTIILVIARGDFEKLRESADYEERFLIPIETVHQHMVTFNQQPKVAQLNKQVRTVKRYTQVLKSRLIRGDFKTHKQYIAAAKIVTDACETEFETHIDLLLPALIKLSATRHDGAAD